MSSEFEIPRACVLTIQGGGALGVELIGQLQGVTGAQRSRSGRETGDHAMNVVGIAGTSAGAIIATLFWAGYTPREILEIVQTTFSPEMREKFFGPYPRNETRSFALVERFLNRARTILSDEWRPRWLGGLARRLRRWLARICLSIEIFFLNRWAFNKKGILQAEGFVEKIDQLLRASPLLRDEPGLPAGRKLTFRDVRERQPKVGPLFLMITDVSKQGLKIVSSVDDDSLDLPIALAVRASASFPIFFQPVRLNDEHPCCIDGGVISNVPTWVFSRAFRGRLRNATSQFPGEAELLRSLAALPWHHVSLRLASDDPPGYPDSGTKFLFALWKLLSGVGRAHIEDTISAFVAAKRFVVRPLATPGAAKPAVGDVLDFNALSDPDKVKQLFDAGRRAAQAAIIPAKFKIPDATLVLPILEELVEKATLVLRPYLVPNSLVRANVFLPWTAEVMRIAYAVNMTGHPDAAIEIAQGRGVTSLCYLYQEPILANLRDNLLDVAPDLSFQPFAPKASPDRTWLLSVPILDPLDLEPRRPDASRGLEADADGPIYGVLNIDACVVYEADGLDPSPVVQAAHPVVRLIFDAMKVAEQGVGLAMNSAWLEG